MMYKIAIYELLASIFYRARTLFFEKFAWMFEPLGNASVLQYTVCSALCIATDFTLVLWEK